MSDQVRKMVHYIENTGGEKLHNALVNEKNENGVAITEHPSMACIDSGGRSVVRHLWEVPHGTLIRCRQMAGKDGVSFREYRGWVGERPRQRTLRSDDIGDTAERPEKPGSLRPHTCACKRFIRRYRVTVTPTET
ncbi:MAG: hypothetical protein Q8L64_05240 [bacterium]|nr:hypothetical protein [bacterium]